MKYLLGTIIGGAAIVGVVLLVSPNTAGTASVIAAKEDAYFRAHGEYLQVLPGDPKGAGRLLGIDIPDGFSVDIYLTPRKEKGYVIRYEDEFVRYSVGHGPEAVERTATFAKDQPVASSTPR